MSKQSLLSRYFPDAPPPLPDPLALPPRKDHKLKVFGLADKKPRREDHDFFALEPPLPPPNPSLHSQHNLLESQGMGVVDPLEGMDSASNYSENQLQKLLDISSELIQQQTAENHPYLQAEPDHSPERIVIKKTESEFISEKERQSDSQKQGKTPLESEIIGRNVLDLLEPSEERIEPSPQEEAVKRNVELKSIGIQGSFQQSSIDHSLHKVQQMLKERRQGEPAPAKPVPTLKNYLSGYGNYEKDVDKLINRYEKVSELKEKDHQIQQALKSISPSPKKTHSESKPKNDYYFAPKAQPVHYSNYPQMYAQPILKTTQQTSSQGYHYPTPTNDQYAQPYPHPNDAARQYQTPSGNHSPSHQRSQPAHVNSDFSSRQANLQTVELPYQSLRIHKNNLQEQLSEKVNSMEKIIHKFRQISQTLSMDYELCNQSRSPPRPDRSIKNFHRSSTPPSLIQQMAYNSQDYSSTGGVGFGSTEINPKTIAHAKTLDNFSLKQPIMTTRTQKKSYQLEASPSSQCECDHYKMAKEISDLQKKIAELEKKQDALPHVRSLDGFKRPSYQREAISVEELHESPDISVPQQKQATALDSNDELTKRGHRDYKTSQERPKRESLAKQTKIVKKTHVHEKEGSKINSERTKFTLNFPHFSDTPTKHSTQAELLSLGQAIYRKMHSFAMTKQQIQQKLRDRLSLKVRKYSDCVQYWDDRLKYHLVCHFRGKIYFGEWSKGPDGCKQGYGFYHHPRKYTYEGEFDSDRRNGKGTINYSNGDIYSGDWFNGKKHGQGLLLTASGDRYQGTFYQGRKHGLGEERLSNGDHYQGEFKSGKLQGQGIYKWADGSIFRGGFKNGLLHGVGVWKSKQNDSYEGEYRQNKKHGYGTYKWNNGMIFSGYFAEDEQVKSQPKAFQNVKLPPSGKRKSSAERASSKRR